MVSLGLIKFYHFEASCRALRVIPSVSLFRAFYKLTRIGDWLTFEKRKSPRPSLTSRPITSHKYWKSNFFFISARIFPFSMRWLESDQDIKDPTPQVRDYDSVAYDTLKAHPTVLRSFSEHFLVLAGISRNWRYPGLRPVMTYNGQRKLFNFCCCSLFLFI
jgi:hypothetical protein